MVSVVSKKRLDFDDTSDLSDDNILNLTGINREQFEYLVTAFSKLKHILQQNPKDCYSHTSGQIENRTVT